MKARVLRAMQRAKTRRALEWPMRDQRRDQGLDALDAAIARVKSAEQAERDALAALEAAQSELRDAHRALRSAQLATRPAAERKEARARVREIAREHSIYIFETLEYFELDGRERCRLRFLCGDEVELPLSIREVQTELNKLPDEDKETVYLRRLFCQLGHDPDKEVTTANA